MARRRRPRRPTFRRTPQWPLLSCGTGRCARTRRAPSTWGASRTTTCIWTRAAGAAGGAGLTAWSLLSNRLVERAFAAGGGCGSLKDIEHIVILIQENRAFDSYFGTYKGVAGYQDPNALPGVFGQAGYPTP